MPGVVRAISFTIISGGPALSGLCSAVVFYLLLGPDYFLIPALTVSLVVLIVRRRSVQAKLEAYYGK